MGKISSYEETKTILDDDLLLIETYNGTRKMTGKSLKEIIESSSSGGGSSDIKNLDDYFDMLDKFATVEIRRNNFRGKNLGDAYTEEQKTAIKDGSFKGLFLGDYWEIGGIIWRIVDFDYWFGTGRSSVESAVVKTHHLTIMPDSIVNKSWTFNSESPYVKSYIFTQACPSLYTFVGNAFGSTDYILKYYDFLENAINTTDSTQYPATGTSWYLVNILTPTPMMILGYDDFDPFSIEGGRSTVSNKQLALMRINYQFRGSNDFYVLRKNICKGLIEVIDRLGVHTKSQDTIYLGVRPVFGLTGGDNNVT